MCNPVKGIQSEHMLQKKDQVKVSQKDIQHVSVQYKEVEKLNEKFSWTAQYLYTKKLENLKTFNTTSSISVYIRC